MSPSSKLPRRKRQAPKPDAPTLLAGNRLPERARRGRNVHHAFRGHRHHPRELQQRVRPRKYAPIDAMHKRRRAAHNGRYDKPLPTHQVTILDGDAALEVELLDHAHARRRPSIVGRRLRA